MACMDSFATHCIAQSTLAHGVGGGTMSKFVSVFRELASFSELLHTQVELILVERLQRNWLKVSPHFHFVHAYSTVCVG